jgi:hypothetical protein
VDGALCGFAGLIQVRFQVAPEIRAVRQLESQTLTAQDVWQR